MEKVFSSSKIKVNIKANLLKESSLGMAFIHRIKESRHKDIGFMETI
jgi:hypothetical protein